MPDQPNPIASFDMHITKASLDASGVMRWAATNSDTDPDSYNERMSPELYLDFIERIKNEEDMPTEFKSVVCSDYWCGGMPYLSISHYPDLGGKAVPGEPLELFVDGKKLKAKGILFDEPLGHSVWRSLKEDKYKIPEEKIRISIGFLDLAHKHGDNGKVWVRESVFSLCPECLQGAENKVYVKGYLVHLALTRVPVNKRTEMVLEEKADMATKKTRKEDAASIVGEQLADEIEANQKASVQRSDALIEMADTETPEPSVEAPTAEVAEPVAEPVVEAKAEVVERFEDSTMAAVTKEPATYVDNLPYGGATSMRAAESYVASKNEAMHLMDMWSVFSSVVWNVMERGDILDKRAAVNVAVDEFKNVLTAKAMVAFSVADVAENVDEPETHELKPAIDALLANIDNSIVMDADLNGKLATINPTLQELGNSILEYITAKSQVALNPVPTENKNNDTLLAELKSLVQPISDALASLQGEVGILKSQSNAQSVQPKSRIPTPKTFASSIYKSQEVEAPKPGSLRSIINKSVGL